MSRDCFARYLKLTRRALSDAAAIAAAAAAGITSTGKLLLPLDDLLASAEAETETSAAGSYSAGKIADSIAEGGFAFAHAYLPASLPICLACQRLPMWGIGAPPAC